MSSEINYLRLVEMKTATADLTVGFHEMLPRECLTCLKDVFTIQHAYALKPALMFGL